jgi:hypothetical protein
MRIGNTNASAKIMVNNMQHPIEEWWTDYQKALVRDRSAVWARKAFKKVAGIWTATEGGRVLKKLIEGEALPDGGVVDENAWDHEHCELCWTTISDYPTYEHEGYTDGKNWLFVSCYEKYVAPEADK